MAVLNPKLALGTPLRLASLLLLATFFACSGVQKHDGGYIFIPEPEGDAVEQDVESLLRAETGVWLGMPRGVAEDVLLERHGLSSGRQPSSGGVETLVAPGGGYVYLLYYDGPPGSAKILVCGLQLRGVGGSPPPLVSPQRVRESIGGQSYRRTAQRVVSVSDREILFLDREHCAQRDPGPPRRKPEAPAP